jgi:hypothetical protein
LLLGSGARWKHTSAQHYICNHCDVTSSVFTTISCWHFIRDAPNIGF